MCIRDKTQEMRMLSDYIYHYTKSILNYSFHPFNVLVTHVIRPLQRTPLHSDSTYSPDGNFNIASNSQQQDSPVAIFVIGDTRILKFRLMRYKLENGKQIKVPAGPSVDIPLVHGTLFILLASDERPMHRSGYGDDIRSILTFWNHENKGIGVHDNISFGVTLRTCVHQMEVHNTTGLKKMTPSEERAAHKYVEQIAILDNWCASQEKRRDDFDLRSRLVTAMDTYYKS